METKHRAKWLYQVANSYYVSDAYMSHHVQLELRSSKTTKRILIGGCILYQPEQFFGKPAVLET